MEIQTFLYNFTNMPVSKLNSTMLFVLTQQPIRNICKAPTIATIEQSSLYGVLTYLFCLL